MRLYSTYYDNNYTMHLYLYTLIFKKVHLHGMILFICIAAFFYNYDAVRFILISLLQRAANLRKYN
jgi:hypothetical protein